MSRINLQKSDLPYQIKCRNNSSQWRELVLFGFNKYFRHPNFGSDDDIRIEADPSYDEIFAESLSHPFKTNRLRLETNTINQFSRSSLDFVYIASEGCGRVLSIPISVMDFHKGSADRDNRKILEFPIELPINAQAHLKIYVAPKNTLILTIYPNRE